MSRRLKRSEMPKMVERYFFLITFITFQNIKIVMVSKDLKESKTSIFLNESKMLKVLKILKRSKVSKR